ncbi:MAG: LysE family translocator [Rhodospirillales bacterium]|nr:LysE family translocator [Rhodospirillales bacterium]
MLPIELSVLGSFVLTVAVIVMSPGPDSMLIIRHTLSSGTKVGLATVAGVQMGLIGHNLLAVLGISVLISSSPILFKTVALMGAAYLGWLGIESLRNTATIGVGSDRVEVSSRRAFVDAMITNLLNPKVIVLFLALFPNFVDTTKDNVPAQLFTLTMTLMIINTIWQTPLAFLGKIAKNWLEQPKVQRWISGITGAVLLFFAGIMIYEHLL